MLGRFFAAVAVAVVSWALLCWAGCIVATVVAFAVDLATYGL